MWKVKDLNVMVEGFESNTNAPEHWQIIIINAVEINVTVQK